MGDLIRVTCDPADREQVIAGHLDFYGGAWGVGEEFREYITGALCEVVDRMGADGSRLWVAGAEGEGEFAGCIGVAAKGENSAQIRCFLVVPGHTGRGLGKRLLNEALSYCRERGFSRVYLWTVRGLDAAAHLYRKAGFAMVEEVTHVVWGKMLTEERWEMEPCRHSRAGPG
jgi:N-acetylglutamate synthase-like GNAT family acetyltransferase